MRSLVPLASLMLSILSGCGTLTGPQADVADAEVADTEVADTEAADTEAAEADVEGSDDAPASPAAPRAGFGCLAVPEEVDYEQPGPYEVSRAGAMPDYTVLYPTEFEDDCKHPIVAWGNGFLISGVEPHEAMHRHLASWGFVVILSHESGVGTGSHHEAGLDWMLERNDDPDSVFHGRLAEGTGVAGHSQGGQGANNAADHPSVEAVACVQCITQGCSPGSTGSCGDAIVDDRPRLCLTADADTALEPTGLAYEASEGPAFYAQWGAGANHLTPLWTGIDSEAGGQYLRLYAAWFRCFLAGDDNACGLFEGGDDCPVCDDPGWTAIHGKNLGS